MDTITDIILRAHKSTYSKNYRILILIFFIASIPKINLVFYMIDMSFD